MAIVASASGNGETFDPAPAGVHAAICVDVIDLGVLEVTWAGQVKKQHKINMAWQIAEDRDDGKPFLVFKRYTLSLSEKANLRKDLESWRGRSFTRDEEMGFDVETVLGAPCLLNITHHNKGDKTYANVVGIMPLPKGMEAPQARDYVRKVDRPASETPPSQDGPDYDEGNPPPLTDDDLAESIPF